MEIKAITDPFTGTENAVFEFDNGNLLFEHAITKENIIVEYDALENVYKIPAYAFKYRAVLTLKEAAELLGVSKMRVSSMCKTGILKCSKVCEKILLIDYDSVCDYIKHRNDKTIRGYGKLENK